MIKYPNNMTIEKNKVSKNTKKSKLGQSFENIINNSNKIYLAKKVACIYKKPTPIQVVKVSYPSRNHAKITEAFYKIPSTTDYNGIYKTKYIDFEAKSIKGTSFPFQNIYEHQVKHLKTIHDLGGVAFIIIEFSAINKAFIIDINDFYPLYFSKDIKHRKSLSLDFLEKNCLSISSNVLFFDYLTLVNKMYFGNKNQ